MKFMDEQEHARIDLAHKILSMLLKQAFERIPEGQRKILRAQISSIDLAIRTLGDKVTRVLNNDESMDKRLLENLPKELVAIVAMQILGIEETSQEDINAGSEETTKEEDEQEQHEEKEPEYQIEDTATGRIEATNEN